MPSDNFHQTSSNFKGPELMMNNMDLSADHVKIYNKLLPDAVKEVSVSDEHGVPN